MSKHPPCKFSVGDIVDFDTTYQPHPSTIKDIVSRHGIAPYKVTSTVYYYGDWFIRVNGDSGGKAERIYKLVRRPSNINLDEDLFTL